MKKYSRIFMIAACLLAPLAFSACQQTKNQPRTEWTQPLPTLDKIEECRGGDLSRSYNSTVRFKLYDCSAYVTIDDMGRVTAFKPDDAAACEEVLSSKC